MIGRSRDSFKPLRQRGQNRPRSGVRGYPGPCMAGYVARTPRCEGGKIVLCRPAPVIPPPASWPRPVAAGGWCRTTICKRLTASSSRAGPGGGSRRMATAGGRCGRARSISKGWRGFASSGD
jgi:hypothetical protein